MNLNDLYNSARSGQPTAQEDLFRDLSVRLRVIANQKIWDENDAEDVAQEALAYIAREYSKIEIRTSFAAWAAKVLDNRVLSYIKAKRTQKERVEALPDTEQYSAIGDSDAELKVTLLDCLKKIAQSNPRYARIINLHYQGYTTEEVCGRLNMTPNHSYVALSRARSMLTACLEKGGVEL
ncbi:MAG: sigma-70 family RNA polymerase sigma factor [candidate division Zixibacteria bacterium]|nr:sigma-70 family RNA polymerase sigma factor [candidate division Zixibacteria bacterium]MDH3935910.1 sigma-70 family RNA polymerase sigma factor [candidate division Zixibacteria bacterium]MDH4032823.1 sigma-70 family RNA polymerase sigma factor [candidate division Zixibacteria bacterium]